MPRKNQHYMYVSFTNDILMGIMLRGSVLDSQLAKFFFLNNNSSGLPCLV